MGFLLDSNYSVNFQSLTKTKYENKIRYINQIKQNIYGKGNRDIA